MSSIKHPHPMIVFDGILANITTYRYERGKLRANEIFDCLN
ncbi:MAG: hypothetical protein ACI9E1_000355 [Cryomorphaceae bacterium]|jgi:hypothetical protein